MWDRVHIRMSIKYVRDRQNLLDLVQAGMRRRLTDYVEPPKTTITLDELKGAHDAALQLPMPEATAEALLTIKDELETNGIVVSTRRVEDGWAAAHANAWRKGHESVEVADLDILQHMWWSLQADEDAARKIILGLTNPGEKAALDFLDELDKERAKLHQAMNSGLDPKKVQRVGIEVYKNCNRLIEEAQDLLDKAEASGSSTVRIMELTGKAKALQTELQSQVFGV